MVIQTERLEIVPLNLNKLKLWIEDIHKLEKEIDCLYKAEAMDGFFLEIVKKQYVITRKDPDNYLWHSFFLLIHKDDRVVVGSTLWYTTLNLIIIIFCNMYFAEFTLDK